MKFSLGLILGLAMGVAVSAQSSPGVSTTDWDRAKVLRDKAKADTITDGERKELPGLLGDFLLV